MKNQEQEEASKKLLQKSVAWSDSSRSSSSSATTAPSLPLTSLALSSSGAGAANHAGSGGVSSHEQQLSVASELGGGHHYRLLSDSNNQIQSSSIMSNSGASQSLVEHHHHQQQQQHQDHEMLACDPMRHLTIFDNPFELEPSEAAKTYDMAAKRLRELAAHLEHGSVPQHVLHKTLEYAACVLESVKMDQSSRRVLDEEEDDLSEVQSDAVPNEVRKWLETTFTRNSISQKRQSEDKLKFRSVANAIRAGIVVDRIYRRMSSSTAPFVTPEVAGLLKSIDDWSFDCFSVNNASQGQVLKSVGYELFNRYGLIYKFKIQTNTLKNFLTQIECGYSKHKNPYHNNLHAADVTQTVHYMLWQAGLANWLSDLEIFASLLAAIIHDYLHTGTTNNFHVMSRSDTALTYNDRAVLENYHICQAFTLLKQEDCNILSGLSKDEYREFRSLVIDMVLATDMSSHFQQIKAMKSILNHSDNFNADKSKILSLVIHVSDVSHPAKRWELHNRWTQLLMEEFFRQGDREKELDLECSPLCDRETTLVAESQLGFIEFIVSPSLEVCGDVLDRVHHHMVDSRASVVLPAVSTIPTVLQSNSTIIDQSESSTVTTATAAVAQPIATATTTAATTTTTTKPPITSIRPASAGCNVGTGDGRTTPATTTLSVTSEDTTLAAATTTNNNKDDSSRPPTPNTAAVATTAATTTTTTVQAAMSKYNIKPSYKHPVIQLSATIVNDQLSSTANCSSNSSSSSSSNNNNNNVTSSSSTSSSNFSSDAANQLSADQQQQSSLTATIINLPTTTVINNNNNNNNSEDSSASKAHSLQNTRTQSKDQANPRRISSAPASSHANVRQSSQASLQHRVKRPWIPCLERNKRMWQERAVQDAKARESRDEQQPGDSEGGESVEKQQQQQQQQQQHEASS